MKIVTCADKAPIAPYYLFDQFLSTSRKYGFEPLILGWGRPWKGLGSKPRLLLEAIESGLIQDDYIIFADAFDVVFARNPNEILDSSGDFIEWNAEKYCFPDGSLAEKFSGIDSPFKYLNSGFSVGPTELYRQSLIEMKSAEIPEDYQKADGSWVHQNDQDNWMRQYLFGNVSMKLDTDVKICMATYNATDEEFERYSPVAYHLNGRGKTEKLAQRILEKI